MPLVRPVVGSSVLAALLASLTAPCHAPSTSAGPQLRLAHTNNRVGLNQFL
jgi:hypothetical protein